MNPVPDPQELVSIDAEPGGGAPGTSHDPYGALRFGAYRKYALGGLLANIGSNMQSVAIGWELYERTGSAMALGWVGLVQALPIVLLALPAGHVADRLDRKRIVAVGQVVAALCSIGLAILSMLRGPVSLVYGCLALGAVARAFSWPAGAALLPLLVPKEQFSNAVTWRSTCVQIASVAGPALGGLLIAQNQNCATVYFATAGLVLANAALVSTIASRAQVRAHETVHWKSLLAGIGFVWRTKVILAAITLDMFGVLLGGATALLPIYAKDILHVGPSGLGWLRAAPSFGALVMGVSLAHLPPLRSAGKALLGAVAGFGAVTIVFGLSPWFWLSLGMLALSGALDSISVIIRHSLVQLRTPDSMRGRVSAVNTVFISCSNELGEFESGTVAAFFGPVFSVVSGGVGTLLVVALVARNWPEIRALRTLRE